MRVVPIDMRDIVTAGALLPIPTVEARVLPTKLAHRGRDLRHIRDQVAALTVALRGGEL
jgi:hypothetical protein